MKKIDEEIAAKEEELAKLKKYKELKETFETIGVEELRDNILVDVKYTEIASARLGVTNGKILCIMFKLNGEVIRLEVEEDKDVFRARLMQDNVKRVIAGKFLDEIYKALFL